MKYWLLCLALWAPITIADDHSVITQSTDGETYYNEYFDLNIKKPTDWYYQPPEDTLKMSKMGGQTLAGDDENAQHIMKQALDSSLPLFSFFQYPPGTPGKLNANIVGIAENIALFPGVKNGCDYLANAREILMNSSMEIEAPNRCTTKTIGHTQLSQMDIRMKINKVTVKQVYSACLKDDHAISIIETFFDESGKKAVDDVLSTLSLECF
jgi:hypothetical protein